MSTTRLLAINFGGIGDEVLFLPTLQAIRNAHPDWHITLLLEPRSKSVCQITNLVDDCLTFDIKKRPLYVRDLLELVSLMRSGGFDAVLSSGSSPLVSILLFLSGIKIRIGYDSGPLSHLLLSQPVTLNKNQYAGNMYHDLVTGLGIRAKPELPQSLITNTCLNKMTGWLKHVFSQQAVTNLDQARPRVVLHPGTSRLAIEKGINKTWPAASWHGLITSLLNNGYEVILAGGPDDAEPIKAIMSLLEDEPSAKQQSGRFASAFGVTTNLGDLLALISLSQMMICVDSAPMHLGVSLNKPLIALFGPTDPQKLLPQDKHFRALCSPAGPGVTIPPETVFQAAKDLWQENSSLKSLQECH